MDAGAVITGSLVVLRSATRDDIPALVRIRATPEVYRFWRGGDDLSAAVEDDFAEPGVHPYVIVVDDAVVGWIQWQEEDDPDYRHASIDIYVDPVFHNQGVGTDAVASMARYLFAEHGHHRIEIDPATDNAAAIRAYTKVGFRPVGITRRSERGPDDTW